MGSGYIVQRGGESKPSGTISITENETVDVIEYAYADVNVVYPNVASLIDRSITSIQIPNGLTSIRQNAFRSCTLLTSATIPSSVTSIGNWAFIDCTSLTSVTVKSTTPPTAGTNLFNNTHADLIIYVPAGSVETYKAAANWSTYASRIQAIT